MAESAPERERNFLGLTHNPFVEPQRGFFERGGRKTYLEQLRHLSEWSRRVLLVTGAEGVGKTTLYRELAATLEPRVKAARINGSLVNTGFEVLSAIAQGFGLATPPDANTQSLRMDLVEHIEAQTASDRLCLALVDDAHQLDNKALESLIALAHECGLHLVFFGEVRMVPMIERTASARGVGWQEIRLTGYGEADARDYLEWRFSQAKYRGRIPFTDNEVRDLVKLSEGLPGRINQMANVLLVKLETGDGVAGRQGFPRLHGALLALLVVLVGLLYLVVGEGGADDVPEAQPIGEVAEADPAAAPEAEVAEAGEALTEPTTQAPDPQVAPASEPENDAGTPSETQPEPEAAEPAGSSEMAGAQASSDATAGSEDEAPAAAAGPAPADVAAEAADPTPEAQPETAAAEPAQPAPSPAPAIDLPPGAKGTAWLLEQNPDHFTIQLVTVSSADSASTFVARQQQPAEFAVYQLARDDRILHVVLYGLFSSRSAAQTAADNLPAEVGRVQPWIRPVGQVQDAARLSTRQ